MSLGNMVKDMTKRDLYVLVMAAGMTPNFDVSWLIMHGDSVIKAAELMADKMLARVPEFGMTEYGTIEVPEGTPVMEEMEEEDLDVEGSNIDGQ